MVTPARQDKGWVFILKRYVARENSALTPHLDTYSLAPILTRPLRE